MRTFRQHLLTFAVLLLGLLLMAPGHANLGASPSIIKVDLTKRRPSGIFVVTNTTQETTRYRARVTHFSMDDRNGVEPVEADEYSIAEWVRFNPKEFTIEPGGARKVRYTVVVPKNRRIKERDYWAAIEFEPLKGKRHLISETEDSTYGYEVFTNILVPIFAKYGETNVDAQVDEVKAMVSKTGVRFVSFKMSNPSDYALRLRGDIVLTDSKGNEAYRWPSNAIFVLPQHGVHKAFKLPEDLAEGNYQFNVELKQDNSPYVLKEKYKLRF